MTKIYDQHKAAFAQVEAFVVLKDGERVATIAFKFPRDGAGRLYAYMHWLGLEMVRGSAAGGGYDKHTAACASAQQKIMVPVDATPDERARINGEFEGALGAFCKALEADTGPTWDRQLRDAGFTVLQAV